MKESKFDTAQVDEKTTDSPSSHSVNSNNQHEEMIMSRSQKHKATRHEEDKALTENVKAEKPSADQKTPWWATTMFWIFRKSIAPIIMIVMLLAGLYIGYSVFGGQTGSDIFKFETWKHMWDLIFADV